MQVTSWLGPCGDLGGLASDGATTQSGALARVHHGESYPESYSDSRLLEKPCNAFIEPTFLSSQISISEYPRAVLPRLHIILKIEDREQGYAKYAGHFYCEKDYLFFPGNFCEHT